jgi:hypothetical protein
MKTNHQRQFKERRDPNVVFQNYIVYGRTDALPLSGRSVSASVTCGDHTNGKRGIAKDKAGAKKFLVSRARFHEKAALKKIVETNAEH